MIVPMIIYKNGKRKIDENRNKWVSGPILMEPISRGPFWLSTNYEEEN